MSEAVILKIVIKLNDREISLTEDEAKTMKVLLDKFFPAPQMPIIYPAPLYPKYPYWPEVTYKTETDTGKLLYNSTK